MHTPLSSLKLTDQQESLIRRPLDSKIFLRGPAGSGKSTVGVLRLQHLLSKGIPGQSILILTPQRTLQDPYLKLAHSPEIAAGIKDASTDAKPQMSDKEIDDALLASRVNPKAKKPSVEAVFHAWLLTLPCHPGGSTPISAPLPSPARHPPRTAFGPSRAAARQ